MAIDEYDYKLINALHRIEGDYGEVASIRNKRKVLLKFGNNENVGTDKATIMTLPTGVLHETYATDNVITTMSSSNVNDDQILVIEGHTLSNGEFTFVVQTAILNGTTQVLLDTPLARVTRAYNTNMVDLQGAVYFYRDGTSSNGVPDNDDDVHLIIPQGSNQSKKASTTISKDDYLIITTVYVSVLEKSAAFSDVELQFRQANSVFRQYFTIGASSTVGTIIFNLDPCIVIPSNSDVRLVGESSTASVHVTGGFNGYLASVGGVQ